MADLDAPDPDAPISSNPATDLNTLIDGKLLRIPPNDLHVRAQGQCAMAEIEMACYAGVESCMEFLSDFRASTGRLETRVPGLLPARFREVKHGYANPREYLFCMGNVWRKDEADDKGRQGKNEGVRVAQAETKTAQLFRKPLGNLGYQAHVSNSPAGGDGC